MAGRVAERIGEVRVGVACGVVATAVAIVASEVLGAESGFWTRWVPCVAILYFASSAWFAMILSMCLPAAPPDELSVATATTRTSFQVGTAIGVAVVVVVLGVLAGPASLGRFRDTYVFVGVMFALATVVFSAHRDRTRSPGTPSRDLTAAPRTPVVGRAVACP